MANWAIGRCAIALMICAMAAHVAAAGWAQVRDRGGAVVEPAGTASVIGRVVSTADRTNPIARALVTVTGGTLSDKRTAVTDEAGRFTFGQLPAGRYSVTVAKAAYLPGAFGAMRPGRQGTTLAVSDGATVDVEIRLARGAVVEGRVTDELARPLPDLAVYALNARSPETVSAGGQLPLAIRAPAGITDDRGIYRIFGLPPGAYVIAALLPTQGVSEIEAPTDREIDRLLSRQASRAATTGSLPTRAEPMQAAPESDRPSRSVAFPLTYYPGVPVFSEAQRITLQPGTERVGLDFAVVGVPVGAIEGTVARADGRPLGTVELSLMKDGPRLFFNAASPVLEQPVDESGRFRYSNVSAGRYTVFAKASGGPSSDDPLFAVAVVNARGASDSSLSMVLRPGVTLSGRLVVDAGSADAPGPLTAIRIRVPIEGGGWMSSSRSTRLGNSLFSGESAFVGEDGTFAVTGVPPGRRTLAVILNAELRNRWWLRSAVSGGRDLLDGPFEVGAEDITDVVLTLTDRHSELAGTLQSADGLPAPEFHVVVFPADPGSWFPGSRRIRSTRPATDGGYVLRDLPGSAYLVGAVTDLEPEDLEDVVFLAALAAQSIPVTLVDGERVVQDLRIAR